MEDTGLSLMCASTGVLTWSRTSRSLPVEKEELLLEAWRLCGEARSQRIIGDFRFALHDLSSKMLWCVRDFVGTRPFFYSHLGKVAFSNVAFLAYGDAAMRGYVDRRHCFASSRTGLAARKALRRRGWCAAHTLSGTATIRECVGNSCANSTASRRREGRFRSQPVSASCWVWAGPLSPALLNRKTTKKPARG
jgi:hypothetical protein